MTTVSSIQARQLPPASSSSSSPLPAHSSSSSSSSSQGFGLRASEKSEKGKTNASEPAPLRDTKKEFEEAAAKRMKELNDLSNKAQEEKELMYNLITQMLSQMFMMSFGYPLFFPPARTTPINPPPTKSAATSRIPSHNTPQQGSSRSAASTTQGVLPATSSSREASGRTASNALTANVPSQRNQETNKESSFEKTKTGVFYALDQIGAKQTPPSELFSPSRLQSIAANKDASPAQKQAAKFFLDHHDTFADPKIAQPLCFAYKHQQQRQSLQRAVCSQIS